MNKICTRCKCGYPATLANFAARIRMKDGLNSWCRICDRERAKEWAQANAERTRERKLRWSRENRALLNERNRKRRKMDIEASRNYNNTYFTKRRLDPVYRLQSSMSGGIGRSLKDGKSGRHWEHLVGYSIEDLKNHLESQFTKGMNWGNYGKHGWHIDHIRPVSDFNFVSPDDPDFKVCWSLWNLQPMWGKKNMSKGSKCEAPPLPLVHNFTEGALV